MLFCATTIFGQWKYKSEKNQFDGNYKIAYVVGKGTDFPYNNPVLVINEIEGKSMNLYLGKIGYTGCDRNNLKLTFGDDIIYRAYDLTTNNDNDVLFISSIEGISLYEFVQKLMDKSKLYVRFSSSCTSNDMEFTLSGSTKAIKYAASNWLDRAKKEIEADKIALDPIRDYYNGLGCDDLLDTVKVMHTDYISLATNLFKTKEGTHSIEGKTLVKIRNSNGRKYNFKIETQRNGVVNFFHIDAETATYFIEDEEIINIMDEGMKNFMEFSDNCE